MSQPAFNLADVKKSIPSIFATRAHSKMSTRYAFISSAQIIDVLVKEHNFQVVSAVQRSARRRDPRFTRHMITLRPKNAKLIRGEAIPQLVFTNSHDGQSKFQLAGGLYRVLCENGLVTSIADDVCIKTHLGDPKVIIEAALAVVARVGKIEPVMAKMMKKKLDAKQVAGFAIKAAKIAYDEPLSFDPQLLLAARRVEDEANTVWTVFNRIQENIVRGGIEFKSKASGRQFSTRGLTHIGRSIDMNRQLWAVAEKLAV
jgi:hypothetical protein